MNNRSCEHTGHTRALDALAHLWGRVMIPNFYGIHPQKLTVDLAFIKVMLVQCRWYGHTTRILTIHCDPNQPTRYQLNETRIFANTAQMTFVFTFLEWFQLSTSKRCNSHVDYGLLNWDNATLLKRGYSPLMSTMRLPKSTNQDSIEWYQLVVDRVAQWLTSKKFP